MRAIDTNVLVRLLVEDDVAQSAKAEAFLSSGGAWVSLVVLAETIWVLQAVYQRTTAQIRGAVETLLDFGDLTLQDNEVVIAALHVFANSRRTVGFTDCLVLEIARKAGHLPLGTFDRKLGRVDGAAQL